MHHSGGAATETIYIYGDVIDQTHARLKSKCKTRIVGLGLGYIEICWALSLIKQNIKPSDHFSFHSFEVAEELRLNFLNWIQSDHTDLIYDTIAQKLNPQVPRQLIKQTLREAMRNGSQILGDIKAFNESETKWNIICYDAFSRKTNENLWSFEFLNGFLEKFAATDCQFSTYACTAILKKSLKRNGFELINRPGFSGKRESTLAHRNPRL